MLGGNEGVRGDRCGMWWGQRGIERRGEGSDGGAGKELKWGYVGFAGGGNGVLKERGGRALEWAREKGERSVGRW